MRVIHKKLSALSSADVIEIASFQETEFCTIFHEVDFNRVASDVFRTEFAYKLVYNSDGKLIAMCPLHSIKDGSLRKSYSNPAIYDIRYGGWIYNRNEVSLQELIDHLQPSWRESLTYWSVPQIGEDDYSCIEQKREFQTGIIDLSVSLEDILQKCIAKKRRETIRSASRKGVVVDKLDQSNLDVFIEQCDFLKISVGLRPLPRSFFVKLARCYYAKKQMSAFVSKLGNDYLASGVIVGNKFMTHLWIAGKPENIPANVPRQDLLVWETIKWAKEQGSEYFDLCVVEQERLPNVARFKLGFSKNIVPFYCIRKSDLGYRMVAKTRKIFGSQ